MTKMRLFYDTIKGKARQESNSIITFKRFLYDKKMTNKGH